MVLKCAADYILQVILMASSLHLYTTENNMSHPCHQTPNPCGFPHQICVEHTEQVYECRCIPGYHGGNCMFSACDEHPCQNWGTCFVGQDGKPECSCTLGHTGSNCEITDGMFTTPHIGSSDSSRIDTSVMITVLKIICGTSATMAIIITSVYIAKRCKRRVSSTRACTSNGITAIHQREINDSHLNQEVINDDIENTMPPSYEETTSRTMHRGYDRPPLYRDTEHTISSSLWMRSREWIRQYLTSLTNRNNSWPYSRPLYRRSLITAQPYSLDTRTSTTILEYSFPMGPPKYTDAVHGHQNKPYEAHGELHESPPAYETLHLDNRVEHIVP